MSRFDEAMRRKDPADTGAPPAPEAGPPRATARFAGDRANGVQVPVPAADDVADPWAVGAAPEPTAATTRPEPTPPAAHAPAAADSQPDASIAAFVPEPVFAPERPAMPEPSVVEPGRALSAHVLAKLNTAQSTLPFEVVEQYRRLAATLHHAQADRGIKTVMICSALGGEGKSLTATNLALTLSESYRRRVLLVDADLRRPSLNKVFELPETAGLSDGLLGGEDRRLPVVQFSSFLTLLPAGRPTPDPMAWLTSNRMKHIIAEAREAFDWVIVDTPPIAVLTDASLLSAMVDSAVLVVRSGHTPLAAVKKALDTVGRSRTMGVVLNRVKPEPHAPYHDAYYSRHYGSD